MAPPHAVFDYLRNGHGDVVKLIDGTGTSVVQYTYDTWGAQTSCTGTLATTLGQNQPFRYRGYVYDTETGWYYLQSRYYDPEVGRFVSSDVLLSTGQGVLGHNSYAYCGNNPVCRIDPTGEWWLIVICVVAVVLFTTTAGGCSSQTEAPTVRTEIADALDLNIGSAHYKKYNCYGNAIGKQIKTDPTGYKPGWSVEDTFKAVQADLGGEANCRRLSSIDDPIEPGWYRVALRVGSDDYHFIRQYDSGWYNKSGTTLGLYIPESMVDNDVWYPMFRNNGKSYYITSCQYDSDIIYFAVREGWDD